MPSIPPRGRGVALCSVARMLYLALALTLGGGHRGLAAPGGEYDDVIFCDGVSAPVPLLRLGGWPVFFYCHFPDKLLVDARQRRGRLAHLYRVPLDWLEEVCVASSSCDGGTMSPRRNGVPKNCDAARWEGSPAAPSLG